MNELAPIILEGEILGGQDGIRVVGRPHPLKSETVEFYAPQGASVAEIVEIARTKTESRLPRRIVVRIDGEPVPKEIWASVRPKAHTTVTFQAVLEGGEGMRSIFGILLAVVALVVAPWLAGPVLGLTGMGLSIGTALIGGAITMGGMLLMNALFPVRKPKLDQQQLADPRPTYSLGGGRNQAIPFGNIPVVLGKHRMSPPYASKPYTEVIGSEQFLRVVFCWGYGRIQMDDLKIGDTPLSSYEEVSYEHKLGTINDTALTLFPREVFENNFQIELIPFDYVLRRTEPDINEISVDVAFPNGLYGVNKDNGNYYAASVTFTVDFRKVGDAVWTSWLTKNISAVDRTPLRYGYNKWVPTGQYDVRIRRTSPIIQSSNTEAVTDLYFTALRAFRNEHPIQTDEVVALTVLRLRATSQLNGTLDDFNGVASLETWQYTPGGGRTEGFTDNPADLILHVLCNGRNSKPNRKPVPLTQIDRPRFEAFRIYCIQQKFSFNRVVESAESVWSVVQDIAAAGRGIVLFRDGLWSVEWDERDKPVVQSFTPRNSWNFSSRRVYRKFPHAFRVQFINELKHYKEDERIVYMDGYNRNNATDYESIEFPGVTDPAAIYKHARFHMAQAKLRPEIYKIETDWENLACTRGDRVRLSHDVPLIGQIQGRVRSISGNIVTLDETLVIENAGYHMRFRRPDGGESVFITNSSFGEVNEVTLVGSDPLPVAGDLFLFGPMFRESSIMRVLQIEPGPDMTATLTLVDDAPEISDADTGAIPEFDSNITDPINLLTLAPSAIYITERLYLDPSGGVHSEARITWTITRMGAAMSFEVQLLDENSGSGWRSVAVVPAPQDYALATDLASSSYSFRVRTLFGDGTYSAWRTINAIVLLGIYRPPENVENFLINTVGEIAFLSWSQVAAVNLSHYEIRYSPRIESMPWGSANVLLKQVVGNRVQIAALDGTYLIKAVTKQGVYSNVPAILTTQLGSIYRLNVVDEFDEHPGYTGFKQGVARVGNFLQLAATQVMSDWPKLADVPNLYRGTGTIEQSGIYNFASGIDLGDIFVSRITPVIDAIGISLDNTMSDWVTLADIEKLEPANPSEWEVTTEIRTSEEPAVNNVWGPWQPMQIGDYRGRSFQWRMILEGNLSRTVTPAVRSVHLTVDMPDRVEAGDDILVPGAGLRISFAPEFLELRGVALAVQDRQTGDREEITLKDETGFNLRFYNNVGAGVQRRVDWVAKGYGYKLPPLPAPGYPIIATAPTVETADIVMASGAVKGRAGSFVRTEASDTISSAGVKGQAAAMGGTLLKVEASDALASSATVGVVTGARTATFANVEASDVASATGSVFVLMAGDVVMYSGESTAEDIRLRPTS